MLGYIFVRKLYLSEMGSWQIVKFTEENDMVEAVPSSWIFKESGRFQCLWPKTISAVKVAAAIRAQEEPKENWENLPVEIMSCVPYDNFQVATKKAKMAEYTSELDTETDYSKGERKRQKKRNPRYVSSEDESPFEKVVRRSPRFKLPTPPRNSSQFETDVSLVKRNLNLENNLMPATVLISSNLDPSTSSPMQSCSQFDADASVVTNDLNKEIGATTVLISSNSDSALSKNVSYIPPHNICSSSKEYTEVIRLLHIINGRVTQNAELITALLNQNNEKFEKNEPKEIDLNIPAKSYIELMEIDQKLLDPNTREFMVKKLLHIGGIDVKDVIKRSMPHLVDDELLRQFSWVGGKGKKKFSTLSIATLIKEVCKRNPLTKQYTEKVIEERLAIFLTKSTERCSRRMIKENKQNNHDEVSTP